MDYKFISGTKAAKQLGIHINTLRKYADEGKIEIIKTKGGIRRYNVDKYVQENTNVEQPQIERKKVCYCRVSKPKQKADLEKQIQYMKERYPTHEIITDIGSGVDFDRKGLRQIVDYAITNQLEELVVSYKDRLCRIGYNLIEYILVKYSNTKIIVDNDNSENINDEVANDIIQILTVYTAKIHGMRKYKKLNL